MAPKKDRGDATRSERKAKRRIAEDRIPDLPGDSPGDVENEVEVEEPVKKKRRRDTVDDGKHNNTEAPAAKKSRNNKDQLPKEAEEQKSQQLGKDTGQGGEIAGKDDGEITARKSKKERKAERKALQAAAEQAEKEKVGKEKGDKAESDTPKVTKSAKNPNKVTKRVEKDAGGEVEAKEKSSKAPRFIVFVGNLPFTATKASIQEHFAKVKPKDVRNLTEKSNPSKSRGIAFIEFEGYDHMKTCLKLMHHSEFNDGKSAPRKINVELTAGGGGKTKQRTAKIAEKNSKLQEERFRRVHEEEKVKAEKRGADNTGNDGIHPSRRGRLGLDS